MQGSVLVDYLSWKIERNEAKIDKLEELIAEHEEENAKTIEEIESVQKIVQKTVEVPQAQYVDKIVDVPVEKKVGVPPKRELGEEERVTLNVGCTLATTEAPGGIAGTGVTKIKRWKEARF